MNTSNYIIIMAGGVGTRFWPFSRQTKPKQFHDVLGTGRTLIQQTADRFEGICPKENIYVVTSQEYYGITKEQLPFLDDEQILLEPGRRNTAPCIAYACYKISKKDPAANIVVAPADHIILKEEEFRKRISIALDYSKENEVLVTLGIKPTRPDTGYGYIHFNDEENSELKKVKTFTEKPQLELAEKFLESGDYVWNAGIFVWNAKAIEKAFVNFLPEMADALQIAQKHFYSAQEKEALDQAYTRCRAISIDNGIMEKADNVYVVLSDIGWSDLGTWKSVFENSEKDEFQNAVDGNAMLYDTQNCVIKVPKDRLVVTNGLDGFIVAEFDNVLMICKKDDEQKVKQFVADAELKGKDFI
ncbi:mannose-1-phosphate guanylyltransferase [Emticicia sp. CRIBPO]|uniref:mannose-1-phosphate guanylyltransferase n=1 Tax=Emticicia sp. CRIBPO TaxID=2683258 RepID=UPI0014134A33|nr:mannose-1-phosphate guanylyltransferase [Emticicia sp. CRIBPO]NBA87063.1 mannose-1-phosphate guanylyltransferase [Emticicia sp. CRIBPO]